MRRRPRPWIRGGFSLLEILLALALAVVLITAISASVQQAWRLSAQGKTELERQQVARAVFRLIERDLRSVMFVPASEFADDDDAAASTTTSSPKQSGTSSSGGTNGSSTGSTDSSSSSTTTSSTSQPQMVMASRGIWGDQFSIEIDGARPQREIAFALPVSETIPSMRTSDLRTIMYQLGAAGTANGAQNQSGLARREGDRYAITSAEMAGHDASGNFSSAVIAPEIIELQFRYSDGVQWLTMWDSVSAGRLPRAVEVQIRFAPAQANKTSWLNAAVNQSTQSARVVIFLPASDPVPEEETL